MATVTDRRTGRTYSGRTLGEALDNFSRATTAETEAGTGRSSRNDDDDDRREVEPGTGRSSGPEIEPGTGRESGESTAPRSSPPDPVAPPVVQPPPPPPPPPPVVQPPAVQPPPPGPTPEELAEIRAQTAELLITQFLSSPGGVPDFANLRNQLFNTFSEVGWSDAQVMDWIRTQQPEAWNHALTNGGIPGQPPVVDPPVVDPPVVDPPVVDPPVVDPPVFVPPTGPNPGEGTRNQFDDPLLSALFPNGIDFANLAPSEFRSLDTAGQAALQEAIPGLYGMSPFMQAQLQRRVGDATDTFRLGAALGRYGQAGVTDRQIQLGGQSLQALAEQNARQHLTGPLTSNSFSNVLEAARQGIQTGDPQSLAIMAALRVGSGGSALSDFEGISSLVNRRNNLLPPSLRSIFGAAIAADQNRFLGTRSSAEVSPAEYISYLQSRGLA